MQGTHKMFVADPRLVGAVIGQLARSYAKVDGAWQPRPKPPRTFREHPPTAEEVHQIFKPRQYTVEAATQTETSLSTLNLES